MNFKQLTKLLNDTNEKLFQSAVKAVNTSLTIRNWLFGYYIVEFQQNGEDRAVYGEKLLQKLSAKVKIRGVSETNLKIFRQFYHTYPQISQTVTDKFNTIRISQTPSDLSNIKTEYDQNKFIDLNILGSVTQKLGFLLQLPNKKKLRILLLMN